MPKNGDGWGSAGLSEVLVHAVTDSGLLDAPLRTMARGLAEIGKWAVEQMPDDFETASKGPAPSVRFADGRSRSGVVLLRQGVPAHWLLIIDDDNEASPNDVPRRQAGSYQGRDQRQHMPLSNWEEDPYSGSGERY